MLNGSFRCVKRCSVTRASSEHDNCSYRFTFHAGKITKNAP